MVPEPCGCRCPCWPPAPTAPGRVSGWAGLGWSGGLRAGGPLVLCAVTGLIPFGHMLSPQGACWHLLYLFPRRPLIYHSSPAPAFLTVLVFEGMTKKLSCLQNLDYASARANPAASGLYWCKWLIQVAAGALQLAQLPPCSCLAAPVLAAGAMVRGTLAWCSRAVCRNLPLALLRSSIGAGAGFQEARRGGGCRVGGRTVGACPWRSSPRWWGRRERRVLRWGSAVTFSSCSARTWAQRETLVAAFC